MTNLSRNTHALVQLARDGDRDAFTSLYAHLAPALHAWSRLRLSPTMRDRMEPDDLIHEVWWRALDAFDSFEPEKGSFRTWLFTIATRVLVTAYRRTGTATRAGFRDADDLAPSEIPQEITDVGHRVARDGLIQDIVEALRSRDEIDQAVFVHCGLEGLSAPAAARLIGKSESAIAKRWHRLREALRQELPAGERLLD